MFHKGQVVLYSDLTPWEVCTILEVYPETDEAFVLFSLDEEPIKVSTSGIRTINWTEDDLKFQRAYNKELV